MLPYHSLWLQTPGDVGPPAGTPSQLGLKQFNTDTTDTVPWKLKHRTRTPKRTNPPPPHTHTLINDLPLLTDIEQSPIGFPTLSLSQFSLCVKL